VSNSAGIRIATRSACSRQYIDASATIRKATIVGVNERAPLFAPGAPVFASGAPSPFFGNSALSVYTTNFLVGRPASLQSTHPVGTSSAPSTGRTRYSTLHYSRAEGPSVD